MTKRRRSILVCLVAAAILAMVAGWHWYRGMSLYTVTILPSLGGGRTFVHSINDRGQVVGVECFGQASHLLLWDRDHRVQDMGPVARPDWTLVINNAGQICGTIIDPNGSEQAFLWEPGKGRTMLGTLAGGRSFPFAMNNHGQIIGFSRNYAANSGGGFLWDRATGMRELRVPGRRSCWPMCINDAGQILVVSYDGGPRWCYWHLFDVNGPGSFDAIPPDVWPSSMNGHGCLTGICEPSGKPPYLVLWSEHKPPKKLFSVRSVHPAITRLNDRSQFACTDFGDDYWERWRTRLFGRPQATGRPTTSYLWDPKRGRAPLDRYVPDAERFEVEDLNNHGCIVGEIETKNGQQQAVLLEPIPKRWTK